MHSPEMTAEMSLFSCCRRKSDLVATATKPRGEQTLEKLKTSGYVHKREKAIFD